MILLAMVVGAFSGLLVLVVAVNSRRLRVKKQLDGTIGESEIKRSSVTSLETVIGTSIIICAIVSSLMTFVIMRN